ncbi:MAG: heparinase II/III family protein [Opitutae bacterium]|nr:heparinase II/III family protein [Opitutae bacterium]
MKNALRFLFLATVACASAIAAEDNRPRPLPLSEIVVRGNTRHPCVALTAEDVAAARDLARTSDWVRRCSEQIEKNAAPWLAHDDAYWLRFLPKADAIFSLGFTGCPVCGSRTNLSPGVGVRMFCDWEHPGQVRCEKGHWLPDAEHPDTGAGYTGKDGRKFYLAGQFNSWMSEEWTTVALPALAQAYLFTGDEKYAERGLLFLDALASIYKESTTGAYDYPEAVNTGRLSRPQYQVARALMPLGESYDAFYASPAALRPSLRPGCNRRANIETNLLLDGAYYCYRDSWSGALHNGHADYLRGALAVGCLLDIPEFIDAAVNGPYSINAMLANNLDRDGQYYETSPLYALHATHLYVAFATPLHNLRNREYPQGLNLFADPRLSAAMTLPDQQLRMVGRQPNFGDCSPEPGYLAPGTPIASRYDYQFAEHLLAAADTPAARAKYAAVLRVLAGNGTVDTLRATHAAGRWNRLLWQIKPLPQETGQLPASLQQRLSGSWVAGVKGLALLRAGDQAALLRFGPTLNHGDPDELAMLYYANGYELSYDIGYGLGSTHVHVGWASSTVSHALVTVDQQNQSYSRGNGGSLLAFAALPSAQFVSAETPLSYGTTDVKVYRRALALTSAGYLADCFRVEGGKQHDYGFGSLGRALESFGTGPLAAKPGSLHPDYAWGEKIGGDGDIIGYPNRPSWKAPGEGYGFFFDVRRAPVTAGTWGGLWRISDYRHPASSAEAHPTTLRMHLVGDASEPIFAAAPGLYPHFPPASYVLARRQGKDLRSTFLAVYEPAKNGQPAAPRLQGVERAGDYATLVRRVDGAVDVILFGPGAAETPYGRIEFTGDFAFLTGDGKTLARAESLGAERLSVAGRSLLQGRGVVQARIVKIDAAARAVEVDADLPDAATGQTAIFSNPAWTRTSGYQIARAHGRRLELEASTLSLGAGRVQRQTGETAFESDIPHEYAKTVERSTATRFFDGKELLGRSGGSARLTSMAPGSPAKIAVTPGSTLKAGERFDYMDLSPGDALRISLPAIWTTPAR